MYFVYPRAMIDMKHKISWIIKEWFFFHFYFSVARLLSIDQMDFDFKEGSSVHPWVYLYL